MQAAALLAASLALAAPPASSQVNDTQNTVTVSNALIRLIDHVMVPAQEAGVLASIDVKAGTVVEIDDVIGQILDIEARLQTEAAKMERDAAKIQAENDASVKAARATAEVAAAELRISEAIVEQKSGAISKLELERLKLTQKRAELQTDVAVMEQDIAVVTRDIREKQLAAAQNALERRCIKAPLNGIVMNKFRHVGEWVSPGDPIVQIVRLDRLRVEGFLDARELTPQDVDGREITLRVKLPHGKEVEPPLTGKIDFVSQVVEDSGEFRVWAEIDNYQQNGYWVVRPGLDAEMIIHLDRPAGKALTAR